jgi:hypothetical protein
MKLLISLLILLSANSTYAQFSQEQRDRIALQKLSAKLHEMAEANLSCEADSDCLLYPAGSKACGGPTQYIIASTKNEYLPYVEYLAKLLTEKEHQFNARYHVISDCSLRMPPVPVCEAKICKAAQ